MNSITKYGIGIDISQEKFDVCFRALDSNGRDVIKGSRTFRNSGKGMSEFHTWVYKRVKVPVEVIFVMEATGVYHENLAYFLEEKSELLRVELPMRIKHFRLSKRSSSKTDKIDASIIASYALERIFKPSDYWRSPSKGFKGLRDLSRLRKSLLDSLQQARNQLHALVSSHDVNPDVLKIKRKEILFFEQEIVRVEDLLLSGVEKDKFLHCKVKKAMTIKGVGILTAVTVIVELDGFSGLNNVKQLVSYCGLDVVHNESGKFKGKTKISKRGNSKIRCALFMPALTASSNNPALKDFYQRVIQGKSVKTVGIVAVMRKLLILIYFSWKYDREYDPEVHLRAMKNSSEKEG